MFVDLALNVVGFIVGALGHGRQHFYPYEGGVNLRQLPKLPFEKDAPQQERLLADTEQGFERAVCPEVMANVWEYLYFSYLNPWMSLGYRCVRARRARHIPFPSVGSKSCCFYELKDVQWPL